MKERELGLDLAEMGAAERAEGWYYRWIWRAWFGSLKAGDGAVGSAVRDRERKMTKCSGRLCGCGGEMEV